LISPTDLPPLSLVKEAKGEIIIKKGAAAFCRVPNLIVESSSLENPHQLRFLESIEVSVYFSTPNSRLPIILNPLFWESYWGKREAMLRKSELSALFGDITVPVFG
jgi:hypothetical protein